MCDRWSTFPTVPRRTYWQVHTSVGTRMGDRSASRSVRRADIYQAMEVFWRYEGHFNEPRAICCVVNSFSVCAHLDIAMEHMYNEAGEEQKPHGEVNGEEKNKHKDEGERRRRLDAADRKKIAVELEKYSHPSMTSNQVSITSAMAKWRQTQ